MSDVTLGDEERLLVQRQIALILDRHSVYMSGPSPGSMRYADSILSYLERSQRLVPTACNHVGWSNYRLHGMCCPDCGTMISGREE